ncbi:7934_t:CDS:2, partial [Entrophospora sp. SA101]
SKKEMWEKYNEEYPNGLKRTSFMCRLDGQFKYREDLGGLCITCDFYGYQVFNSLIESINNSQLYGTEKNNLINKIELLRRHLKSKLDGHSISSGEDIVISNESLAGTSFGKLTPNRSKKISVGTIPGISNYFTF